MKVLVLEVVIFKTTASVVAYAAGTSAGCYRTGMLIYIYIRKGVETFALCSFC